VRWERVKGAARTYRCEHCNKRIDAGDECWISWTSGGFSVAAVRCTQRYCSPEPIDLSPPENVSDT
jgi:hypothetical protein